MTTSSQRVAVIVLAAGKGTRMKSDKAKVLHEIMGCPMVLYVAGTANKIAGSDVIMVVGHQADTVRGVVSKTFPEFSFAYQSEQLGTGHAVQCALPHIGESIEHVVILCGDVPLLTTATIDGLLAEHVGSRRDLTVLAVELEDPAGYGRVMADDKGNVVGIVEEADANSEQKKIKLVNSGIYCTSKMFLTHALGQITDDNAQREYYLTDVMAIGRRDGNNVGVLVGKNSGEVIGVNTLTELELAEKIMKNRKIKTA